MIILTYFLHTAKQVLKESVCKAVLKILRAFGIVSLYSLLFACMAHFMGIA